jgi:hypothetical protein
MAPYRALVVALVLLLSGCRGCGAKAGVVAELVERQGATTRELAASPGTWSDVAPGATFALGDAVRTDATSTAKVELATGGGLQLRENTTVRFLNPGTAGRRVGVETGEAEIESGLSGLSIQTTLGLAQLEPGSLVHVTTPAKRAGARDAAEKEARFDVLVGRAQLDSEGDAGIRTVEAGQRFFVKTGIATLEPIEKPAAPVEAGQAPTPQQDAASPAEGAAPVVEGVQADVRGDGVRTAAHAGGGLTALPPGSRQLETGSRLVVPDGATVDLTRGDEHVTVSGRADVSIGKPGASLLKVQSGRVSVGSQTVGLRIDVPGGTIVLAAPGAGKVAGEIEVLAHVTVVASNNAQFRLEGKAGTTLVAPGQSGKLDTSGVATTEELAPSAADVTIPAGESPVIHSPRGVAHVRVRFDACPEDAIVEVSSGPSTRRMFARGQGISAAVLPLGLGAHKYAVRCVGSAESGPHPGGTIQVLRDSGAAPLPRMAPVNTIDADGRRYSVLYQNLLPQLSFRWRADPAAGALVMHLERPSGLVQKFPATAGTVTLPAGGVREGLYKFWFETEGTHSRSAETTVQISFDNAAPAAEIHQPVDGQASGATIHVSGVATEGSAVSAGGAALPMDSQFRFEGDVPGPQAGDRSIAVRIAHPAHGVHYYLRMLGTP